MACPATELEHTEAHSVKGLGCAVQADLQFSELPSGLALKMLTILYSEKREETLRILSVIMTLGMQHTVSETGGAHELYIVTHRQSRGADSVRGSPTTEREGF